MNGNATTAQLEKGKGYQGRIGLDPRHATRTCRHSYATHLYRASGADLEIPEFRRDVL